MKSSKTLSMILFTTAALGSTGVMAGELYGALQARQSAPVSGPAMGASAQDLRSVQVSGALYGPLERGMPMGMAQAGSERQMADLKNLPITGALYGFDQLRDAGFSGTATAE